MKPEEILIIGAGPAGLAASLKLVENEKKIILLEKEDQVGGLCKTKECKGFRFDLGGHRFFTKSSEVNELWEKTLGKDFLIRPRISKIYYKNRFFNYPLKPFNSLSNLGIIESIMILKSYIKYKFSPYKNEENFEQWVCNRFGKRLFNHFFKSYTEKLWGIPCNEISAEWAAQRIKGLSLTSAIKNSLFKQKNREIKTLVSEFKYPKYGAGMMYDKMAENIKKQKGKILLNHNIIQINHKNFKIKSLVTIKNNQKIKFKSDYIISSMPITELIQILNPKPSKEVLKAAENLKYRSLITVNLILKSKNFPEDNWIYVHSSEVKLGRIQNFKQWSPHMVKEKRHISLGLEYSCEEGDNLWDMSDEELKEFAFGELELIRLVKKKDFVDAFVTRIPKAYPIYDLNYQENLEVIKRYLSKFRNLQLIGRYGMFKYNNMDHSILTGLCAAENILGKNHNIWGINVDKEYQEEVEGK